MMWSSKTQPTPANIRKRLLAAVEAVQAARVLIEKKGDLKRFDAPLRNAEGWLKDAIQRTKTR